MTQALQSVPDLNVFKSVVNGKLAIDMLKLHPDIDLITLDMEVPVMDGLETILEIRKFNKKVTIIIFSSQTLKGAEKTIAALTAGADDFVTKSVGTGQLEESLIKIIEDLLPKILAFTERILKWASSKNVFENELTLVKPVTLKNNPDLHVMAIKPKLIVIGISTGGPDPLIQVFKTITENVSVPMLIVQHMPPIFTEKLASTLSLLSPVKVREAKNGDKLTPGLCLLAPGDFHTTVTKNGEIILNQNEKVCFVRPSVDVLLNSIAENYDKKVLNIIMTGMGEDGAKGTKKLQARGDYTYIQSKETCVVWGMPGAVFKAIGDKAQIISLSEIGSLINSISRRI